MHGHDAPCGALRLDDLGFSAYVWRKTDDGPTLGYLGDFFARHKAVHAICAAFVAA